MFCKTFHLNRHGTGIGGTGHKNGAATPPHGNCEAHNTDVGREQVCTDSDLGPDGKGEA